MSSYVFVTRKNLTTGRSTLNPYLIAKKTPMSEKSAVPITTEFITVEVTVSHTDAAQPIVTTTIATIVPPRKRTASTIDVAGIIPLLVVKTTIDHAATIAMMTGAIITGTTVVDPKRISITKINVTAKSTDHVLTHTKIAA